MLKPHLKMDYLLRRLAIRLMLLWLQVPHTELLITVSSPTCRNSSYRTYHRLANLNIILILVMTCVFKFFSRPRPQVHASLPLMYCSDRGAEYERLEWVGGGPRPLKQLFLYGLDEEGCGLELLHPRLATGLTALTLPNGWSHIHIPSTYSLHTYTMAYVI